MKWAVILTAIISVNICSAQLPVINQYYFDYYGAVSESIIPLDYGCILIGRGWSAELDGWMAVKIKRLDEYGFLMWEKSYGKVGLGYWDGNRASSFKTKDGNSIINIGAVTDTFGVGKGAIRKFDFNGNLVWQHLYQYAGPVYSGFSDGAELSNGNIAAFGFHRLTPNVYPNLWLVVTDSTGNPISQQLFGGAEIEQSWSLIATRDGGFIIAGMTGRDGTTQSYDTWVMKADSVGNIQWDKKFGDHWSEYRPVLSNAADGGYYVCWNSEYDWYINVDDHPTFEKSTTIIKIDSTGEQVWSKTLYNTYLYAMYINQIRETDSGRAVILVGQKNWDSGEYWSHQKGMVLKLDSSGNVIWSRYYSGPVDSLHYSAMIEDFQILDNGNIACTGFAEGLGGYFFNQQYFWLLTLDSMGCLVPGCDTITGINKEPTQLSNGGIKIYPNPSNGNITIENLGIANAASIGIYTITGQEVYHLDLVSKTTHITLNIPSGLYFYRALYKDRPSISGKFLIE